MRKIQIVLFFIMLNFISAGQNKKQSIQWLKSEDITNTRYFIWRGDTIDFTLLKDSLYVFLSDSLNVYVTPKQLMDSLATLEGGHDPVSLNSTATSGGLSLSGQELSFTRANNSQNGYLDFNDFMTFQNKLSSVSHDALFTGLGTTFSPLKLDTGFVATRYWVDYTFLKPGGNLTGTFNGQNSAYYLNYNNLINAPVVSSTAFGPSWESSTSVATMGTLYDAFSSISGLTTNLTYNYYSDKGIMASSTGTGDTIPAGSTTYASLMLPGDKTKLNGIAEGAEVNINADWNATTGDGQILNKPDLSIYQQKGDTINFITPEILSDSLDNYWSKTEITSTDTARWAEDNQQISIDSIGRVFIISLERGGSIKFEDTNTTYDLSQYQQDSDTTTWDATKADLIAGLATKEPANVNIQQHITNDGDLSSTNEIQSLSWNGSTGEISIIGGGITQSIDIDGRYLQTEVDGSTTNELITSVLYANDTLKIIEAGVTHAVKIEAGGDFGNAINAYAAKVAITSSPIIVNWPDNFNNENYFLNINAYYPDTINGKIIRNDHAVYDFVKTVSGFQFKVDKIAGFVEYFAADTTNLYPIEFDNYISFGDTLTTIATKSDLENVYYGAISVEQRTNSAAIKTSTDSVFIKGGENVTISVTGDTVFVASSGGGSSTFSGVKARTISNHTGAGYIYWGEKEFDTHNYLTNLPSEKFYAPQDGYYVVNFNTTVASNLSGYSSISTRILINGNYSVYNRSSRLSAYTIDESSYLPLSINTVIYLSAGQWVSVIVDSFPNPDYSQLVAADTFFYMYKL